MYIVEICCVNRADVTCKEAPQVAKERMADFCVITFAQLPMINPHEREV